MSQGKFTKYSSSSSSSSSASSSSSSAQSPKLEYQTGEKEKILAEALLDAAENGDAEAVEKLITQGAPLNAQDKHGKTPLFFAADNGHLKVVEIILRTSEGRATLSYFDSVGFTALYTAVWKYDLPIIQEILRTPEGRATLSQTTGAGGLTPLHLAARGGDLLIIQEILRTPEGRATVSQTTRNGYVTPLHFAAWNGYYGSPPIVQEILRTKESSEIINQVHNGTTILYEVAASYEGAVKQDKQHCLNEIGVELLMHGADFSTAKEFAALEKEQETLNNLELIYESYLAKKSLMHAPPKSDVKQQFTDTLTSSSSSSSSSRVSRSSSGSVTLPVKTPVVSPPFSTDQHIQTQLLQGKTDTLLAELQKPFVTPNVQTYLQQNALTDILHAKANPKNELKSTEQVKLTQAMQEVLQKHPAAILQRDKDGLTPMDIALQEGLPSEIIDTLQHAEQHVRDQQDAQFLKAVQDAKPEDKQSQIELVTLWRGLDSELQAARQQLRKSQTIATTPIVTTTPAPVTVVTTPATFTDAQKAQIELARQLFNIKLTQVFTKALAIKYKLVDAHNQSRVGMVVGGSLSLIGALIPVPGASLLMQGFIEAGKFVINKSLTSAAQRAMEKRDISRHDRRLGETETMDQAAERVAALVEGLTRRYQCVLAQLDPASVEIFVNSVVDRMIHYWDNATEKLAGVDDSPVGQRLVDFTQPLPKHVAPPPLTETQQFDYFMENMILGSSLWQGRKADVSGRIAKRSARSGLVGKAASFMVGDRQVYYQSGHGPQPVMVQTLCQTAPTLTWTGDKDELDYPRYRHCHPPQDSKRLSGTPTDLPELYLSQAECRLRRYKSGAEAAVTLPIPPKEFSLSPQQREIAKLRAELAKAKAETVKEKTRADLAETKASGLEEELRRRKPLPPTAPRSNQSFFRQSSSSSSSGASTMSATTVATSSATPSSISSNGRGTSTLTPKPDSNRLFSQSLRSAVTTHPTTHASSSSTSSAVGATSATQRTIRQPTAPPQINSRTPLPIQSENLDEDTSFTH